ncbi:MAG: cation diffusion facilitator family transporter [Bacteroidia bacterium]
MQTHNAAYRLQSWVLATGILLLAVKLFAWYLTASNAILTDALESLINVGAGAFALYSLHYAALPRDKNHPYGHGKIEFLSSGLEGIFIAMAGAAMSLKAIYNLWYPQPVAHLDWGLVLTLGTGLVNGLMGWLLLRQGRRQHSQVLAGEGQHLLSDAWSSLGLVVGLGIVAVTDWLWMDQVLTLLLGVFIIYTGVRIVRGSLGGVLDETDEVLLHQLAAILQRLRRDCWIDFHNLRIIRYGAAVHIDCHLTLPWYLSLAEAHAEVKAVEQMLRRELTEDLECFIHADPCRPTACSICALADCPKRKHPFGGERVLWTAGNLRENQYHTEAISSKTSS